MQGVDTAARIGADAAKKLKAEGVSFVGRYLGPESWGKTITKPEADALRDAGLAILLCYETTANRMREGAGAGEYDGLNALRYAQALSVPQGTTIFFACDYNAPMADWILLESYVKAAQAALGCAYTAGVYGPEKVVSFLSERGVCDRFWQCVAWSNQFLPVANVRQYQWQGGAEARALAAKVGFAVDLDSAEDLRGLWLPEAKPEKHWYDEAMAWARKEGIMDGTRPEDFATRAEVAQMFLNYNRRFEDEDGRTVSGLLSD